MLCFLGKNRIRRVKAQQTRNESCLHDTETLVCTLYKFWLGIFRKAFVPLRSSWICLGSQFLLCIPIRSTLYKTYIYIENTLCSTKGLGYFDEWMHFSLCKCFFRQTDFFFKPLRNSIVMTVLPAT